MWELKEKRLLSTLALIIMHSPFPGQWMRLQATPLEPCSNFEMHGVRGTPLLADENIDTVNNQSWGLWARGKLCAKTRFVPTLPVAHLKDSPGAPLRVKFLLNSCRFSDNLIEQNIELASQTGWGLHTGNPGRATYYSAAYPGLPVWGDANPKGSTNILFCHHCYWS